MIQQIVPDGICLECRGCCRFRDAESAWTPSLLLEEIAVFEQKNIPKHFYSPEKRKILPVWSPGNEMYLCPFVKEDNYHCQIYSFRPFECALYPFLLSLRGKQIFLSADTHCPYLEEKIHSKEVESYIQYLHSFLSSPSAQKWIKKNIHLAQNYEDVHYLKFCGNV